jgi:hypothetical protein
MKFWKLGLENKWIMVSLTRKSDISLISEASMFFIFVTYEFLVEILAFTYASNCQTLFSIFLFPLRPYKENGHDIPNEVTRSICHYAPYYFRTIR